MRRLSLTYSSHSRSYARPFWSPEVLWFSLREKKTGNPRGFLREAISNYIHFVLLGICVLIFVHLVDLRRFFFQKMAVACFRNLEVGEILMMSHELLDKECSSKNKPFNLGFKMLVFGGVYHLP